MKTYKVPHTDLIVSRIAYGCGMWAAWNREPISAPERANAARLINTAYDNGITFFDHADIYAFGKCEEVFGRVLKQSPGLREKITIQTMCGRLLHEEPGPNCPDLSRAHIVGAAEGSLRRLGTDHLDILLLHVPDALVEPEDVAQAFDELHREGKVRHFGVSNHTPHQIELLKKCVRQPLVANQIHIGLALSYPIADGLELTLQVAKGNHPVNESYMAVAGPGTLDYCRLHDIQIQAWSPLRRALRVNASADAAQEVKQAARLLVDLAREKDTTPAAIALAWLLRHPAGIVPITGTMDPKHLVENCAADRIILDREEWYALFAAAGEVQSRRLVGIEI